MNAARIFKTPKGTELPLMDMRGKEYLEVKWRVLWFREERPDWSIQTHFVELTATSALAQAVVRDKEGRVLSTSHKFEDKAGFGDFREKAETGAIGRALALLGYGTQNCGDELDENQRIVDSGGRQIRPDIKPEQPEPGDGRPADYGYRIPFGQWKQRSLEDVYKNFGPQKIDSYIKYIEDSAAKKGKAVEGDALDFINRASEFLGSMENRPLE